MINGNVGFSTGSTTLGVGLVLGALFLGTGGSSASINVSLDRSGNSQAVMTNSSLNIDDVIGDDSSSGTMEFQKLSLQMFETYGFSVKQYSDIMQVTRTTIYKWHNLNAPLAKVQSKNRDRLKSLNESLCAIKEKRKKSFAKWLRNPLDTNANIVFSLLTDKKIVVDSLIEQLQNINVGLHSFEASERLDRLLDLD